MTRRSPAWRRALLHSVGIFTLVVGIAPVWGQDRPEPTLADAWVTWQQANPVAVNWQHAYALRHDTAEVLSQRRRRLIAELGTLLVSARVAGDDRRVAGLQAWRDRLAEWDDRQARTPGRHDLPWLGANLRHNPPISRFRQFGVCEMPTWVEVWSLDGVSRLAWRSGMTLDDALAGLSSPAARDADHAVVVSPTGERHRRGVAAWNHQATPLVPGSRVMLELPSRQGLRDALPFPGAPQEVDLVNARLPRLLATRLPGDVCTLTRMP